MLCAKLQVPSIILVTTAPAQRFLSKKCRKPPPPFHRHKYHVKIKVSTESSYLIRTETAFPWGNANEQCVFPGCSHLPSFNANNTNNPDTALLQTTRNVSGYSHLPSFNANNTNNPDTALLQTTRNAPSCSHLLKSRSVGIPSHLKSDVWPKSGQTSSTAVEKLIKIKN